jgi:hypothetical protein
VAFCDYGTLTEGKFLPDPAASAGGACSAVLINRTGLNPLALSLLDACQRLGSVTLTDGIGSAAWSIGRPHALEKLPPKFTVRSRFQILDGGKWVDSPKVDTVRYSQVAIP